MTSNHRLYPKRTYPVLMKLQYKTMSLGSTLAGMGISLTMSSTKVSFTADASIETGTKIELSMEWPAQLDDGVALKLIVEAKITSIEGLTFTADIQKYRFRTRGRGARLEEITPVVIEWPRSRAWCSERPAILRAHA